MKELKNMVIVEETITTGYMNDHGKVVASSKTKRKALVKEYAEKLAETDETIQVIGQAYEVIRKINGKSIRQVLTLEDAESIEGKIEQNNGTKLTDNKEEKPNESQIIEKAKPGPKPKKDKEEKEKE